MDLTTALLLPILGSRILSVAYKYLLNSYPEVDPLALAFVGYIVQATVVYFAIPKGAIKQLWSDPGCQGALPGRVIIAILGGILSYTLIPYYKQFDLSWYSPFKSSTGMIFTVLLSWILLGETLTLNKIIAVLLFTTASYFIYMDRSN